MAKGAKKQLKPTAPTNTCGTCDMCVPDERFGRTLYRCNSGVWEDGTAIVLLPANETWETPACPEYVAGDPILQNRAEMPVSVLGGMRKVVEGVGITLDDIFSGGRSSKIVRARRTVAEWLVSVGYSTVFIGRALRIHHSSVLHLLGKLKKNVGQRMR